MGLLKGCAWDLETNGEEICVDQSVLPLVHFGTPAA